MQTLRNLVHAIALLTIFIGPVQAVENDASGATETASLDEITIDAQRLEVYLDRKMSAIGNAEVHRGDQALYGDRIDYDMINEELHVSGNGRLEQTDMKVIGPDLRMKLGEREGEMKDPVFTMQNVKFMPGARGRAKLAEPTDPTLVNPMLGKKPQAAPITFARGDAKSVTLDGPDREHFVDARYTTCAEGVDDWYLRAKDLELDHSTDTATAKNASVEFKGVPILYTPWIDFPFSGQRKSGFLSPTFGTTSINGAQFSLPYYWNIAPDMDATITPLYMSKRGAMLGGDFRYLGEQYSGRDKVDFLQHDDMTGKTRWGADLVHKQNFGNGWSGSYDIKRVSDDKFLSDMTTNIVATSTVNLPQQGTLSYGTSSLNSSLYFNAIASEFQTLDNKSYPYFRLPEFNLSASSDWGNVTGNMYAQWVSFEQSNNAPDNVKGSRLTSYPNVSLPLNSSYGYIVPKLGAKYWTYNLRGNTVIPGTAENYQSDSTALPIFSVDSGVYFDRNFRVVKNSYTQTLEPRLFYVYIPYQDQSMLPVFDSAQADLNMTTLFTENQFSGNDRVNNANQVSMAVTSRLIDDKTGAQRLAATIGQRYYFVNQKVTIPGTPARTGNNSDLFAAATAELLTHWNLNAAWQYNTDTNSTYRSDFGGRYNPGGGRILNMTYRYTQDSLEQVDLAGEWPLGRRWYGLGRLNYSLRDSNLIEGIAGAEYDAGCWKARFVAHRLSTATAGDSTSLFFQLELGGLTSIGTSPLKLLQRSISGYGSSPILEDPVEEP